MSGYVERSPPPPTPKPKALFEHCEAASLKAIFSVEVKTFKDRILMIHRKIDTK